MAELNGTNGLRESGIAPRSIDRAHPEGAEQEAVRLTAIELRARIRKVMAEEALAKVQAEKIRWEMNPRAAWSQPSGLLLLLVAAGGIVSTGVQYQQRKVEAREAEVQLRGAQLDLQLIHGQELELESKHSALLQRNQELEDRAAPPSATQGSSSLSPEQQLRVIPGDAQSTIIPDKACRAYAEGQVWLSGAEVGYLSTSPTEGIPSKYGKGSKTPLLSAPLGVLVYRLGTGPWERFSQGMLLRGKTEYTFQVNDSDALDNRGEYLLTMRPVPQKPNAEGGGGGLNGLMW